MHRLRCLRAGLSGVGDFSTGEFAREGFEPQYSAPEADVLPLNDGAENQCNHGRMSAEVGAGRAPSDATPTERVKIVTEFLAGAGGSEWLSLGIAAVGLFSLSAPRAREFFLFCQRLSASGKSLLT
jgi:hypothetical protein